MPLTKSLLVKKRPLKSVPTINNSKNIEFSPRHATYNKINSTLALYYKTRVTF